MACRLSAAVAEQRQADAQLVRLRQQNAQLQDSVERLSADAARLTDQLWVRTLDVGSSLGRKAPHCHDWSTPSSSAT